MSIEFLKLSEGECLLWSSTGSLTGEHKIKASLLKSEFGARHMVIAGKHAPKILQSPRSKLAHFDAKICNDCNSSRTQVGDKAFELLHMEMTRLRKKGSALTDQNNQPNGRLPTGVDEDVFRYFAKILCCFLAEVGGPRSRSLSAFARGLSDRNPIFLRISEHKDYEAILAETDTQGFAQHGGLTFRFDDKKRWVRSIESSLLAGGIHYEFWTQLRWLPRLELQFMFRDLIGAARANIAEPFEH